MVKVLPLKGDVDFTDIAGGGKSKNAGFGVDLGGLLVVLPRGDVVMDNDITRSAIVNIECYLLRGDAVRVLCAGVEQGELLFYATVQ